MNEHNATRELFDQIRQVDKQGKIYWTARELCRVLEYSEYRKFKSVIERTMDIYQKNGLQLNDHFVPMDGMVKLGSGAQRQIEDMRLSPQACLWIVMNANSRKKIIQAAQIYFSNGGITDQQNIEKQEYTDIVFYTTPDGGIRVELAYEGDTFWCTQKRMSEIFGVDIRTINYHLQEIFTSEELNRYSVIRKIRITAADGKMYNTQFYNLDVIISVGYRINSWKATQFRIWATRVLRDYITKGFVMDDERFKEGNDWSKHHFELVLERIREIRSSERMLYQKITDIYATADDYMQDSPVTKTFYAKVQNKLHWAITGKTAAEIIYLNADASRPHMGLNTWKLAPNGKVLRDDVVVAKNYLSEEHMRELNRIVSAYLDLAENRAIRRISTTMEDWAKFLDSFLELSSYPILNDKGKISAEKAKIKAYEEYKKFRIIQDRDYLSDFDQEYEKLKKFDKEKKE